MNCVALAGGDNLGEVEVTDLIGGITQANTDWMVDAACKRHDNPEWWFPPSTSKGRMRIRVSPEALQAVAICNECSVKEQCLEYALEWEPNGIWGGADEVTRHKMRTELGIELRRVRGWR